MTWRKVMAQHDIKSRIAFSKSDNIFRVALNLRRFQLRKEAEATAGEFGFSSIASLLS
jgi:hypothetical protein